jgi:hypothetical protein
VAQRRKLRRFLLTVVLFGLAAGFVAVLIGRLPPSAQTERRGLAVDMQTEFRKHGLPYAVATSGETDTVLRIQAPSMTQPFAEFLLRNPGKAEHLGGLGFTEVVFANEKGGTWTYDLEKRRLK